MKQPLGGATSDILRSSGNSRICYTFSMKPQKSALVVVALLGMVVIFATSFLFGKNAQAPRVNEEPSHQGVACTDDAKLCPDGSAVGREGPNCEFPDCPDEPSAIRSE